jgi:hypothetical protein
MEEVYAGRVDAHAYPVPLLVMMLINTNIYSLCAQKILRKATESRHSLSVDCRRQQYLDLASLPPTP